MNATTRTVVYGLVAGAITLAVYYLASAVRGPEVEFIAWNPVHAAVLTVFGIAGGAAWGSRKTLEGWKTLEVVLVANLALVFGLLFLGWGFIWEIVRPLNTLLPGLRDLFYGFWFIAAILAAYILRRPGAALAAETLAALAEFLAGGEWGLTLLISGLVQGAMAELVFAATGYTRFSLPVLAIAGAASGVGSLVVDYFFWYSGLATGVLGVMLVARLVSGAVLAGWLGKVIADALERAGALGSFAISYQEAGSSAA
jgi:energy-coupling factor transport system substrate-specific component